jgi:hypothetical protein
MDAALWVWGFLTKHREIPYGVLPDEITDYINAERDQINTLEVVQAIMANNGLDGITDLS